MTRAMSATWAAVNLAAGLALTFLAPVFYAQVARPLAVGYLLVFGLAIGAIQRRNKSAARTQLLAVSVVSIAAGVSVALIENAGTAYQLLVSIWALAQGSLLLIGAMNLGFKTSSGRDLAIVSASSLILGLVLLIPDAAPRNQLGFFSAYLLITGVLLAIAASTPSK